MVVELVQRLRLGAPPEQAWKLLRDTKALARLVPGVEDVQTAPDGNLEKYVVKVLEKVGPFRLSLNLEVQILDATEPHHMRAEMTGADAAGTNRVRGTLSVELQRTDGDHTELAIAVRVEVLGKLASLGAVPIRRRANELFSEFARRFQEQFPATVPQSTNL